MNVADSQQFHAKLLTLVAYAFVFPSACFHSLSPGARQLSESAHQILSQAHVDIRRFFPSSRFLNFYGVKCAHLGRFVEIAQESGIGAMRDKKR